MYNIFLKIQFYLKLLSKVKVYTCQNILLLHIPWIVMFLGLINRKISNKRKLLTLSSSFCYLTNPSLLRGKFYHPSPTLTPCLENKQNSNPHPLCDVGKIQLRLINTYCFTYMLLQTNPLIIKSSFNLKSENVSFTKLPKNVNDKTYYE